jgi:hypothetical protein
MLDRRRPNPERGILTAAGRRFQRRNASTDSDAVFAQDPVNYDRCQEAKVTRITLLTLK